MKRLALPNSIAIVNCAELVTLAGPTRPRVGPEMRQLSIIKDGAMLVHGDRIAKVGSRREVESLITADCQVVDAGNRIVLPGFIDAHTHPVFWGRRADEFEERIIGLTYQEIAER